MNGIKIINSWETGDAGGGMLFHRTHDQGVQLGPITVVKHEVRSLDGTVEEVELRESKIVVEITVPGRNPNIRG